MIEFLLGSAAILAPGYHIPIVAAYFAAKAAKGIATRRRLEKRTAAFDAEHGVTISWSNLHLTLSQKTASGKVMRHILNGIEGTAYPGRLLAVMGPSGAGKTSLLNALARQVPYNKTMRFSGKISINGISVTTDDAIRQAYVQQEDLFYSQLTLRETLAMACSLRLPSDLPREERDALINDLIEKLGLTSCADTMVGDASTRGLSGGEKKRLSIGCELLNSSSLMFLDEPTTGLDAFQSEKVIDTLKKLAGEGHTILCTIHQPRSSVFSMFDDLILMAEGSVVYCGVAEKAITYFASLGYSCPEHFNPAEFFADLISIDSSTPETKHESQERLQNLVSEWKQRNISSYEHIPVAFYNRQNTRAMDKVGHRRSNLLRDFRLLLGRSWKQARRDKKTNVTRLGMNVVSALIFGGIYFRMRMVASLVQDRVGLLQLTAVNTAMSSLVKTLNVFPSEAAIVSRERSKKAYGVLPYLCAKIISDIPVGLMLSGIFGTVLYSLTGLNPVRGRVLRFLGIIVVESFASASLGLTVGGAAPNTEVAIALGPMVMLLFIVFGGQFKNADTTVKFLQWLPKTSLIRNGFQAMCINEFSKTEFETEGDEHAERAMMKTGDDVLSWLGFGEMTVNASVRRNLCVICFNYWLTYNILSAKKPKFTPLTSFESSS